MADAEYEQMLLERDTEIKNLRVDLHAAEYRETLLREAIQAHLDMEPPATASPYWSKPEGDLRKALDG